MAANGQRLIPLNGINLDVAPQYLKETQARFIKNLYYQLSDLGDAATDQGANAGVLKPLPSNELYCPVDLPKGDNHVIGTLPSSETSELYVFVYNSLSNHSIFRINGLTRTADVAAPNPCFNFQLQPQYFIGEGQAYLEVIYLPDVDTGKQIVKKDLYWTDGYNYQGYLRFDDYLLTNGFDANTFNYFDGDYDQCAMVRMGVPTPNDCIEISQVPFNPATDTGKNNNIKSAAWQFRITFIDVFGRPSEHGIISDEVFLSNNECLGASDMLSRCWYLIFNAGNPLIDKIQIEYRNCNDEQWYLDSVLELYQGSNLGQWWLRARNPEIGYNQQTNKITYIFCKDKLCDPIDTKETNRTQNGLPRSSQALTKIGNDIALADNWDGFAPFDRVNVLEKLSIEVIKPTVGQSGNTANIEIYIRIFNPFVNKYQKVWKKGTDYVFGGIANGTGIDNIKTDYQQYFAVSGQQGYLGYLAGTNNYAVGVQYYLDDNNNFIKDEDFTQDYDRQYFLKFEYTGLPKQVYVFRLASHLADPASVDITTTSTYVGGVWNFSNLTVGTQINYFKELIINVCDADYTTLTSGEMLLTYDMTDPKFYGNRLNPFFSQGHFSDTSVVDGYVYEDINSDTSLNEKPVSLLQLSVSSTGDKTINSIITDHNGFYFAGSVRVHILNSNQGTFDVKMIGYCNCIKRELIRGSVGGNFRRYIINMIIGLSNNPPPVISSCPDFEIYPCSRILIKGKIQLCDSNTGVPNINVVISRGGIATTDSNGEFTVVAYDNVVTGFTGGQVYIMGGACAFNSCNGGCIEIKSYIISPCNSCDVRTYDVGTYLVSFTSNKGLLSGGRYGVEITGYDWVGRHGFAQTIDNLYFNIPSFNDTKTFAPSTVNLLIPPTVTFPDWVDYYTVGITVELNYGGNYIEWIADKVQFVDNSGNENNSAPTQIKIWYASLNEYNAKNNFNTTTGWGIIAESNTSPRTADVVQFIRNGDGVFFPNPISALVKYDQTGQYFLINYTDSLKDLKDNALIRLANPSDCTNKDSFFELCGKYKVINHKSQVTKITLNAFDTYYQYRQIPVPVSLENGDTDADIIELRQFGFPFESPSVTDFWGTKCSNIGRFNVKNPYEAEIIHLNQIALSGALSINAQLNYLNYFDENLKYDIEINNSGGILAIISKTGILLIICQYTTFIMGFNDNRLIVNEAGQVISPSAADKFGKPVNDSIAEYGCQFFDKSTIRQKQGYVMWLDRNRVAILQHNFSTCQDVSRYNSSNSTIISWLTKKIKYQQQYNLDHNNTRYFVASINPSNLEWVLSDFVIGNNIFINNERDINVAQQETIGFDILNKVWKAFYSPTPEYWGYIQSANAGQLTFAFQKGFPFSNTGEDFNTFFGIPCEKVYRFIFSNDGFKKKKFQAIEIYCAETLYFSDLILTEANQQSRLLVSIFKKSDYFWMASFLCDLNEDVELSKQRIQIFESSNLYGTWIDVRLIGIFENNTKYSELYGVIIKAVGQEETG